MTYSQALELLYTSLPTFHRSGPGAYKPGLDTSLALARLTGEPHRLYPTIHIAGTNGKGSTAHTLAAILQKAGYRTGLYTSPHIFDFRERIRVDGRMIPEEAVTEFVERWTQMRVDHPDLDPSFFELTSTLAFEWFARSGVDVAVIETGLGGRLDSTNIITPVLSVITNISPDHTSLLGNTLAEIAAEKAGIIKPGTPVVIGEPHPETMPVFVRHATLAGAPIFTADPLEGQVTDSGNLYPDTPFGPIHGELTGRHQTLNAATVMKAVELLRSRFDIPDAAVRDGFASVATLTGLFGRWSRIMDSPLTIADTGHNCGGWERICATLGDVKATRKGLVIGFVADKDLDPVLSLIKGLSGETALWFSTPSTPRALPAADLADRATAAGLTGTVEPDVNSAVGAAREWAGPQGFVLVAGSNFLIAGLTPPTGVMTHA